MRTAISCVRFFSLLFLLTDRRHAVIYTIRTQTHETELSRVSADKIETTKGKNEEKKRVFDFFTYSLGSFFSHVVRFGSSYWWPMSVIQRISPCKLFLSFGFGFSLKEKIFSFFCALIRSSKSVFGSHFFIGLLFCKINAI